MEDLRIALYDVASVNTLASNPYREQAAARRLQTEARDDSVADLHTQK